MASSARVLPPTDVFDERVDDLVTESEELDVLVIERRRWVKCRDPSITVSDDARKLVGEPTAEAKLEDLIDRMRFDPYSKFVQAPEYKALQLVVREQPALVEQPLDLVLSERARVHDEVGKSPLGRSGLAHARLEAFFKVRQSLIGPLIRKSENLPEVALDLTEDGI